MNKGFLSYSDDENTLTIMKDEPEDLTHLAPTAGDTCVPLVPFNEMLMDHFMLSENYGPLLSDAKEASPASSPYLSYRDEGSLSPGLTHSPSSLPSLLGEESPPLEGTSMSSLLGLDMDSLDSDDLSVKAPYISMSEGDDFPLLMSGDLMWGASMPSPSHNTTGWSSPPPLVDKPVPADMDSSLAKLLRTDSPSSARIFSQHSTMNNSHSTFSSPKKGDIDRRKRPVSELSGSARTNCKRSKQNPSTNTIPRPGVLDGGGSSGGGSNSGGGTRQSNSVLMNLLVSGCDKMVIAMPECEAGAGAVSRPSDNRTRNKSLSMMLLDPDCPIELMDLTQQDYDVNAPAGSLLSGSEILTALEDEDPPPTPSIRPAAADF